uniref:Condensin complex subunit 1 C-terminal domain-containing protein n=1 Tax=Alexandrium monilatum TaxID=311494 RepID=A0A7S4S1N6_9DINO|mmetsp:Transcript_114767/g.366026  ORF Transcript_114767/g.366026 Transcript_114767/m.366026 type:complete len:388 (+) Transcript_114767:39-1202(+)
MPVAALRRPASSSARPGGRAGTGPGGRADRRAKDPQHSARLLQKACGLTSVLQRLVRFGGLACVKELLTTSRQCRACLGVHMVGVFSARFALPAPTADTLHRIALRGNADLVLGCLACVWRSRQRRWDDNLLAAVLAGISECGGPGRAMRASLVCLGRDEPGDHESVGEGRAGGCCGQRARKAAVLSFSRAVRMSRAAGAAMVRPLLAHADASVRQAASQALEGLEKDHSVVISTLAAELDSKDEHIRRNASDALHRLAEQSGPAGISSLVRRLLRGGPAPRAPAVQARDSPAQEAASPTERDDSEGPSGAGCEVPGPVPPAPKAITDQATPWRMHRGGPTAPPGGHAGWDPTATSPARHACTCLICDRQRALLVPAGTAADWAASR